MNKEKWISVDIETDGNTSFSSILSIGLQVYTFSSDTSTYTEGSSLEVNIKRKSNSKPCESTIEFWNSTPENKEKYDKFVKSNTTSKEACIKIKEFIQEQRDDEKSKIVLICYPSAFDAGRFSLLFYDALGEASPNKFQSYDIRSYASGVLGKPLSNCGKRDILKSYLDQSAPHTHNAVDDAIEQGRLFCNLHAKKIGIPLPFKKDKTTDYRNPININNEGKNITFNKHRFKLYHRLFKESIKFQDDFVLKEPNYDDLQQRIPELDIIKSQMNYEHRLPFFGIRVVKIENFLDFMRFKPGIIGNIDIYTLYEEIRGSETFRDYNKDDILGIRIFVKYIDLGVYIWTMFKGKKCGMEGDSMKAIVIMLIEDDNHSFQSLTGFLKNFNSKKYINFTVSLSTLFMKGYLIK
jgi:DNA polymerase III epsilon subunit-like protein